MYQPAATVAVQLTFVDRGGNTAQLQYRLLASLSAVQINAVASEIEARLTALSTAIITKRVVTLQVTNTEPGIAHPQSDVTRFVELLYTNLLTAFSIAIPSPPDDIWAADTWGSNSILDKRNPVVFAPFQAFTEALDATVDEEGNPIVPVLLNGVHAL